MMSAVCAVGPIVAHQEVLIVAETPRLVTQADCGRQSLEVRLRMILSAYEHYPIGQPDVLAGKPDYPLEAVRRRSCRGSQNDDISASRVSGSRIGAYEQSLPRPDGGKHALPGNGVDAHSTPVCLGRSNPVDGYVT